METTIITLGYDINKEDFAYVSKGLEPFHARWHSSPSHLQKHFTKISQMAKNFKT